MSITRMVRAISVAALLCGAAFSQSTMGEMTGTVTDSSGAAVPNAKVEAKSLRTASVRDTVSGPEGIFVFNSLEPAVYNITVKATGFKTYGQNSIDITAGAPRDLGKLALAVGAVTEEVSVTALATPVQTASSENSKLVDTTQLTDVTLRGRDMWAIMATIPGASLGNSALTGLDNPDPLAGMGALTMNGNGAARTGITIDGAEGSAAGSNANTFFEPTVDSIAEMRVLTTNYQAEFGRMSGGGVAVVIKGGSQQFHGTAFVNKRHEMFNANSFFNHQSNTQKSIYRFFVYGYTIGGPVYIPKVWNTQKKRLFFFWSQEYTKTKPATTNATAGVPTSNINYLTGAAIPGMGAGQMQGNFYDRCAINTGVTSACVPAYTNTSGTNQDTILVNPAANKTTLAGGNVNALLGTAYSDPASAKVGQAMLAFEPTPNMCTASAGIYNGQAISPTNCPPGFTTQGITSTNNYSANYFYSFTSVYPRRSDIIRIDWNITSKLTSYVRYGHDFGRQNAGASLPMKDSTGGWSPYSYQHPTPGHGYAVGATYTLTPTMVDEFTFGWGWNSYSYYPNDATQLDRKNMGSPPSFNNFATNSLFTNDQNLARPTMSNGSQNFQVGIPSVTFGGSETETGISNTCSGMCPYTNTAKVYSFADSLSKVWGKHNLKIGAVLERGSKFEQDNIGSYLGAYSFASGSVPMSADTADGFANAYLGNMNNYSEGTRSVGNFWYTDFEFFLQDNWRVSRRLTLDIGVRNAHYGVFTNVDRGQASAFLPSAYATQTPERIYYPACFTPGTTNVVSTATTGCPTADNFAYDPTTKYTTFASYQGGFVPPAVGGYGGVTPNPYPGMVVAGVGMNNGGQLPLGVFTWPNLSPEPRFGFAYDAFGNGRTAIRGGVGIALNRSDFNLTQFSSQNEPSAGLNRTIYYTPVNSITNPTIVNTANLTPFAPTTNFVGNQHIESTYNGSFQIQQNVGFSTVVEASWVFTLRRHIPSNKAFNYSPLGAQYNPSWASPLAGYLLNPAKNGGLTQGNAAGLDLSANYFYGPNLCAGCVFGLGAGATEGFNESSSYHSLQISVRRNMTRHLSYSLAYTYGKSMGTGSGGLGDGSTGAAAQSNLFTDKYRNWGPSYSPTPQYAVITYVYETPNLGQKLNFKPLGWVTDHWTWSGVTNIRPDVMIGVPGITLANSNTTSDPLETTTGSSEGQRAFVVGNYRLSSIGQSPQYNGLGATSVSQISTALGTGPGALQEEAGGVLPTYTTTQYAVNPNGSAGNQIINEAAFVLPFPCSATPAANPVYGVGQSMECYGNAGAGSIINEPDTRVLNFDMTFAKNFPLKSERRVLMFRAEMYNIFNHTQFTGGNTGPSYDWNNWKNGVLVQTSSTLGRYTNTLNPRQMSMSLRLQF